MMALLPPTLAEFIAHYSSDDGKTQARHLQRTFNAVLKRKSAQAHIASLPSDFQKARVAANAMKGAGRALRVLPTCPARRLNDQEVKIFVNDRLGLRPTPDMKHLIACKCGHKMTNVNHYRHFLHCQHTK